MTRTIHRTYDDWKLASPDDEWQGDNDRPPDNDDRDPPEPSETECNRLRAIDLCDQILATVARVATDFENLKIATDQWRKENADLLEHKGSL